MKIQRHYHSCIEITEGDSKILIDPGTFCFLPGRAKPEQFIGIQGIFISHNHADHTDPEAIKTILLNNACKIYSNQDVATLLKKEGVAVEVLKDNQPIHIGSLEVLPFAAQHGEVLVPIPQNTAFFVNKKYLHPGDSFDTVMYQYAGVEVLGLPIAAPWMNVIQGREFLRGMKPKHIITMHDAIVADAFVDRVRMMFSTEAATEGVECHTLVDPKESLEI